MPHIFGTQIPPDKLKQLVQYLAQGARTVTDVAHAHEHDHARAAAAPTGLAPADRARLAARPLGDADLLRHRHRRCRCSIRWAADWDPVWKGSVLVTVELVTTPLGFLVGLGGFDYWALLRVRPADAARGPLRPRRDVAGATTSASTPTTR